MGRPFVYPPRASLHMKVSFDVLEALRKHCQKQRVSLNKGADDLLRACLIKTRTKAKEPANA